MKRYISMMLTLITIFAVLALSACAKPPTAEMDNAEAAVTRAENEPNVVEYAETTLKQAQDSRNRMREAAENKQYDEAKLLAQEASALAERAISEARTGEAAAAEAARLAEIQNRADAENLINTVKSSVSEAEQALVNAQNANVRLDAAPVAYEIETAKELLADAETSLAAGNAQEAEDAAAEARSSASNAMTLLAEAVRTSSRKK